MRNFLKNKWLLGALIVGGSAFALWLKTEPVKPYTCECIEVSGCDCVKGFCKCGINCKTCDACYEHAKRQGKVK